MRYLLLPLLIEFVAQRTYLLSRWGKPIPVFNEFLGGGEVLQRKKSLNHQPIDLALVAFLIRIAVEGFPRGRYAGLPILGCKCALSLVKIAHPGLFLRRRNRGHLGRHGPVIVTKPHTYQ